MRRIDENTDFFAYVDNFTRYKHIQSIRMYGEHKIPMPRVSITIPTYRRPKLLKESVESAINQIGYFDYEIIIVDNDPTGQFNNQIIDMLKAFNSDKIIYYQNRENIGMFGNWNRCIELATGEWVTILSDDDLLSKFYLKTLMEVAKFGYDRVDSFGLRLNNDKELNSFRNLKEDDLYSNIGFLSQRKLTRKLKLVKWYHYIIGCITPIHGSIFRTNLLKKIGGFNEAYWPSSDYILFTCFSYYYPKTIRVNKNLVGIRIAVNESLNPKTQKGFRYDLFYFGKYIVSKRNNVFFGLAYKYVIFSKFGRSKISKVLKLYFYIFIKFIVF